MLYYPGSGRLIRRRLALLRPIPWGAVLFLLWPALAWPQEELTLDQAISGALQHNRQIKAAQLEVDKSDNSIAAMRKYRLPQFEYQMMEGYLVTPVDFLVPKGLFGVFSTTGPIPPDSTTIHTPPQFFTLVVGQVNQPLSQLYKIGLGVENEKLKQQIAKEDLSLEEQKIVNDVKKTYYNLQQTQSG